jgi:L-alanine-DL-glutamate epimerase-like enolase superfamily enzyme
MTPLSSAQSEFRSTVPLPTDVRVMAAALFFLPVQTRVPLKFGAETLTSVTCARVRVDVESRDGRQARGWGETPLSVQWVWPSELPYAVRQAALESLCKRLTSEWVQADAVGHPLEIGTWFTQSVLPEVLRQLNERRPAAHAIPHLAALVCTAAFDMALHDAFGNLVQLPVYKTYNREFLGADLATLLGQPGDEGHGPNGLAQGFDFRGRYPEDFFRAVPARELEAWHLVGGLDPLDVYDLRGDEPRDGQPLLLPEWIARDGLRCLKIKLRGNDYQWDFDRIVRVGEIASDFGDLELTTDFNCTVQDPGYVVEMLERLQASHPAIYESILYVEQPFPYDLHNHPLDVRAVSKRKPLLMDESADSWRHVRLGRELGWNGVALKTCKTQSGALLSLCWARAHQMHLMVQDLTNPMLAQIAHVQLAAHAPTLRGVESNAMQFYPEASAPEAKVHPGLYVRHDGVLKLHTLQGESGFGYREREIVRELPPPAAEAVRNCGGL